MKVQEAIDIAGNYGEVLKKTSSYISGLSRLPYPREHIKIAIRTCLVGVGRGLIPTSMRTSLEVSYLALSSFIDDSKAAIIAKVQSELDMMIVPKDLDEWNKIFSVVDKESNLLEDELKHLRKQFDLK